MADEKAKSAAGTKDMLLCVAIIRNASISNINWAEVAKEVGASTAHAAQCRWSNFKKVNDLGGLGNAKKTPTKAEGAGSAKKGGATPTPKKNGKATGKANGEVKSTVKSTPKKRKMVEVEDEDEDGSEEERVVETPSKKVKGVNGKATANTPRKRVVKAEAVEEDDEDSEEVETFSTVGAEEDSDDEA